MLFLYYSADLSRDKKLTIKELAIYINGQVRHHIDTGIKQNPVLFAEIDISPRDGLVTWDEYFTYFLKKYDIPKEQVLDAKEGVDYKKLKRKVKGNNDLMILRMIEIIKIFEF